MSHFHSLSIVTFPYIGHRNHIGPANQSTASRMRSLGGTLTHTVILVGCILYDMVQKAKLICHNLEDINLSQHKTIIKLQSGYETLNLEDALCKIIKTKYKCISHYNYICKLVNLNIASALLTQHIYI